MSSTRKPFLLNSLHEDPLHTLYPPHAEGRQLGESARTKVQSPLICTSHTFVLNGDCDLLSTVQYFELGSADGIEIGVDSCSWERVEEDVGDGDDVIGVDVGDSTCA